LPNWSSPHLGRTRWPECVATATLPSAKTVPCARARELRYGQNHLVLPLPRKEYLRHPILQLVRLQSETPALCVRCFCGWLHVDGVRSTLLLARLEFEGDGSSLSAMPRSVADATIPALLCLFGVIAFASELVGVWMSTLDESQPPGAARHASTSCSLLRTQPRSCERERERSERALVCGDRAVDGSDEQFCSSCLSSRGQ